MQTLSSDNPPGLAAGHLFGRRWTVHRVHAEGVGEHVSAYLDWSYDGETDTRHARNWASGDDGKIWDRARAIPEVALAIARAKDAWRNGGGPERARREAADRMESARALRTEAEQRGRACHIRFGHLPAGGHSVNHRDDRAEPGVSVYAAWELPGGHYVIDLRGLDAISAAFIIDDGAPVYEVTGAVLAQTGADGEPLIAGATGFRIHPAEISTVS